MISRRKGRESTQQEQIAELQRERLRLLQERTHYRSNLGVEDVHRRQQSHNSTMPIMRRTSSNRPMRELSPSIDQLRSDTKTLEQDTRNDQRPPLNLELDMSVINELNELSSPRAEQQRLKHPKEKLYALKTLLDGLLDDHQQLDHRLQKGKKNRTVAETNGMQRQNSQATLLHQRKYNRYCHKELQDLEDIESKVTHEIISLRNDKIKLIKTLNEETQELNRAAIQIQRLERELEKAKRQDYAGEHPHTNGHEKKGLEQSDKDAIINNLRRDDDLRIGRQNVRQKIESEVVRYQQEKEIKQLQEKVLFLEQMLQKANIYIKEVDQRDKGQATSSNQQHFLEDIARLEAQLRSAQAVNEEIRAINNTVSRELQEEIMLLKADNEELRQQGVELLQQPERRFTYQQQILRLKAQIDKENEAKAFFAQDFSHFKEKYIKMEDENTRMKKRILELEEAHSRQQL